MASVTSPEFRFRQFRERAGLSPQDAAQQMDISSACIWDLETYEDELVDCYSPSDLRRFSQVLGIRPSELFGAEAVESPVAAADLVRLIREQCSTRDLTLEQFEDAVGWCLNGSMDPPERLFEDMTIAGLQWLCRELGIDWHRVLLSL